MKNYSPFEKANYIVKMIKSANKSLEYAIDTASWYANSDNEQIQIENEIKKIWIK